MQRQDAATHVRQSHRALWFRHRADRVEIAINVAGPEGRGKHHHVPVPAPHLEVEERTLAARRLPTYATR